MKRMWIAALLLAASATMATAADSPKAKFLSLQLTAGTADLAGDIPVFNGSGFVQTGFAPAYSQSEWGGKLEFQSMMGPEYAFNISGGIGSYGEEDKPGDLAPGATSFKYTQNSWNIRIGGDRLLPVGEKTYIFFGPGLEYWSGKAKFDDGTGAGGFNYESKNTTRISLGARLGGHMMVGPTWGITAQVGSKVGHATYKEGGAETSWWPSSMEGSVGLVFKLGS